MMSRRTRLQSVCVVALLVGLVSAGVAQGIITAYGDDTDMDQRDDHIIVQLGMPGKGKWVGCTVFADGDEVDFMPQKASGTVTWRLDGIPAGSHRATVALWQKVIYNCGCYYCNKNGCHMEGEVGRVNFAISR